MEAGKRVCQTIWLWPVHLRMALETVRHHRGRKKCVRLTLSRVRDSSLVTRHAETQPSAEKSLGLCLKPK